MKKYWDKISFIGLKEIDHDVALLHHRDVILLNRLVSVLLITLAFYIPAELLFNGVELIPIILVNWCLLSLPLFFNAKKLFDASKWAFLFTSIATVAPFILITQENTLYRLFMIPIAMIPIVIFKEKWKMIFGFLAVLALYFVTHLNSDKVDDIIKVSDDTAVLFSHFFTSMVFIILFFLLYYLKGISLEYESLVIQKTNEIKKSHEIIEQHNKDITDSINYAKKIQEAYMPPEGVLTHYFPNSFLLFQPKDIVSGDFYWIYSPEENGVKSDEVYIAVADCTGHGVPGAIMSVICCNALNEAAITKSIRDTGKILDSARESIIQNLKSKNTTERKDGMDISLIRINRKTKEIQFSGANNPLWYIDGDAMKEIKADKQPVGMYENIKPFESHLLLNHQITQLFLFTDGYADQFGGPKGKKFKYANLQKLLLNNSNLELTQLNNKLLNEFENWKGDLEQVDDVCIIGIKL